MLYPDTVNPESRMRALLREIKGCPELVEELTKLHWNPYKHYYTKQQILLIKEMLCRD